MFFGATNQAQAANPLFDLGGRILATMAELGGSDYCKKEFKKDGDAIVAAVQRLDAAKQAAGGWQPGEVDSAEAWAFGQLARSRAEAHACLTGVQQSARDLRTVASAAGTAVDLVNVARAAADLPGAVRDARSAIRGLESISAQDPRGAIRAGKAAIETGKEIASLGKRASQLDLPDLENLNPERFRSEPAQVAAAPASLRIPGLGD